MNTLFSGDYSQSRRRLLRNTAAVGAGLGALAAMPTKVMSAAAPLSPRRVVFLYIPGGALPAEWTAQGCGNNFYLPSMAAPLESIKQHCVFPQNLRLTVSGPGTSVYCLGANYTGRSSLDVVLGDHLKGNSALAMLPLSVQLNFGASISYANRTSVFKFDNPLKAYQAFFGTLPANQKTILDEAFSISYQPTHSNFDQTTDLQFDLAALALQRNLTNVVSIQLGNEERDFFVPDTFPYSYAQAIEALPSSAFIKMRAYLTGKFTYLVKLLEATRDSHNQSLLDSTLVVMCSETGNGHGHGPEAAPFLLAGGKNFMRGGYVVDASTNTHLDLLDTVSYLVGAAVPNYGNGRMTGGQSI